MQKPTHSNHHRELLCAESNIDDMNPELAPSVIDALLVLGARDAWLSPIIMKRGRPAFCLHVLFDEPLREAILACIFAETTSLGVRVYPVTRFECERHLQAVETEYGTITVKIGLTPTGELTSLAPEFSECEQAAQAHGVPVKRVYQTALSLGLVTWRGQ